MARFHARQSGDGPHGGAQTAPRWEDSKPQHPLSRVTYALGSIISVGLVIGLGVWGYKLLVRDVSGVPVVRAAEGPMRIQPDDPGGRQTQNQGLSVNDVAAIGAAGTPPDELILAPAPLNLSDEDAPEAVADDSGPADTAQQTQNEEGAPEPTADVDDSNDSVAEPSSEMLAIAEAMGMEVPEPANPADDDADADPNDAVATTLRPKMRPTDLNTDQSADLNDVRQTVAAPKGDGGKDIDPDTIPAGTRLAQLGAFVSEEIAREEWTRLSARFNEYLADKDRVIQKATSGGRTFYRLRAMGFNDLADARRFCSALVAEKAECIPVVTR